MYQHAIDVILTYETVVTFILINFKSFYDHFCTKRIQLASNLMHMLILSSHTYMYRGKKYSLQCFTNLNCLSLPFSMLIYVF